MRGYTAQERLTYWLYRDRIPVVKLLIVSNVLAFLATALFGLGRILQGLAFGADRVFCMPWTLFTYPLVGSCCGLISLLFSGYWLWIAGGSLERSWGSRVFAWYFFLMSAVTALGLCIGSFLTGIPVGVSGLWLPLAGVTVAFAMLDPEQQILFLFIVPLKLKYLALIDVAVVLVSYGGGHPLLGVFALAGCAASYWYVRRGRWSGSRTSARRDGVIRVHPRHAVRRSWNPAKWYRDYRERKRLRDLLGE